MQFLDRTGELWCFTEYPKPRLFIVVRSEIFHGNKCVVHDVRYTDDLSMGSMIEHDGCRGGPKAREWTFEGETRFERIV